MLIEGEINKQALLDLKEGLSEFSIRIQRYAVGKALRAGAGIVADAIREKTPVRTTGGVKKRGNLTFQPGHLKRSVMMAKQKRSVPTGQVRYVAGPTAYYSHMVEFGHRISRTRIKKGSTRFYGMVEGKHFISNAWQYSQSLAYGIIISNMNDEVVAAANRAKLKAMKEGSVGL